MYLSIEILQNIGVTDKMLGVKYSKFGVDENSGHWVKRILKDMSGICYLFEPGALDFEILGKIAHKSITLGKLDQKKCEQVIYILTTFKFKLEAIMADIGIQENGNFKFTFLGAV